MPTLTLALTLCLVVCLTIQNSIELTLPTLKNESYGKKEENPMNVTVGEQFSIYLPQFDIEGIPEDLTVFELSQEKFISLFETMEKHEGMATGEERKKVDDEIFDCEVQMPNMEILQTLDKITQKNSQKFNFGSEENIIYVPLHSKGLLYTLDTSSMVISVYHFTSRKLNMLSSAKINTRAEGKNNRVAMACDSLESTIYIFESQGMWAIDTQTVLTSVKSIKELNGFRSKSLKVDKLYHGSYEYLFGLQRRNSIYMIPETIGREFTEITTFKGKRIYPQDLYVAGRILYVLDSNRGVFLYKILGSGDLEEYDHIEASSYGNKEIIVKDTSIFIKFMDQEGQKIVELNYDQQNRVASLVRYYKLDDVILQMSIQSVPVAYQGGRSLNELLFFLINDLGQIQSYPFNVDPRVIRKAHNGAKMHVEGVKKLIYIFEDLYILITNEGIVYVRIAINKPRLTCKLPESTGHVYYEIQFSSNVSTCEQYDRSLTHKVAFNSNCQITSVYGLYINDHELSRFQKAILYSIVTIVVAGFIIGLMCLIQWRNNKLSLIGRIKDEILRFRDRHRKMQPFVEEEKEKNEGVVEFQMPDKIEPVPTNEQLHEI